MRQFEISTESCCDLFAPEIERLGIFVGKMRYTLNRDGAIEDCVDNFREQKEYVAYFEELRRGAIAKTSILNLQSHVDLFTDMAKRGIKHALHLSIAYGLSPTADNARQAIEIVKQDFPDIDYIAIESCTATTGLGIVAEAAAKCRDEGKTAQETAEFLDDFKTKIQHFIIADDLMYLRNGGRLNMAQAVFGSMLRVKPIIIFTREGKLEVWRKELGLAKAITRAVQEYGKYTPNRDYARCVIVHTDNLPAAEQMRDKFRESYGFEPEIRLMGPIVGAHVGPGTVALGWTSNELRPLLHKREQE